MFNLYVQSTYSFLKSTIKVDEYINFAVQNNFKWLALTDHNYLHASIEFYEKCVSNNIKPIIGLEFYIDISENKEMQTEVLIPVVAYAKSEDGFKSLSRLSKKISQLDEGTTISKSSFLSIINPELLIVFAADDSNKSFNLNDNQFLLNLKALFDETKLHSDSYIGLKNVNDSKFFINFNSKFVPFKLVSYINPTDIKYYQMLIAIRNQDTKNIFDFSFKGDNYLKLNDFFQQNFDEKMLKNVIEIVNKCNFKFKYRTFKDTFIKYKTPNGEGPNYYLEQECRVKLLSIMKTNSLPKLYFDRLTFEIEIIKKMGFANYFLIVADYVTFARNKGILVGPGRGSSGGSLVAYALGITMIDPLKYGLIFERFLNPERITMPDIDLDFQDDRRQEVIEYVAEKYGLEHVAHISTFQEIGLKTAIRDVGRVLGINLADINRISKSVPVSLNYNYKEALKNSFELSQYVDKPEFADLFDFSIHIIGLIRQVGIHAAGIVVSELPIVDILPTQISTDGLFQVQVSMKYLERFGLVKMDFLGLKNLTILSEITNQIIKKYNKNLRLDSIPLNDRKTYEMLSKGQTLGIFQLESPGMRSVLMSIQPTSLEDIVTVSSLYRPGPRDNIGLYISRKWKKSQVLYLDKRLINILAPTFGIIVYQEQILKIVRQVANYSYAQADILRRAIGKKNLDLMKSAEKTFLDQAVNNNYSTNTSKQIWELILKFASYGFNRSHAVAYSIIGYWLAYLKCHYPAIFFPTLINNFTHDYTKVKKYIIESIFFGLNTTLVDINKSQIKTTCANNELTLGFNSVKNLRLSFAQSIIEHRSNKPYNSFINFFIKLINSDLTETQVYCLIGAGAFDSIENSRSVLISEMRSNLNILDLKNMLKNPNFNKKEYINSIKTVENLVNYSDLKKNEFDGLGFNFKYDLIRDTRKYITKKLGINFLTISEINFKHINKVQLIVCKILAIKLIKFKNNRSIWLISAIDETGQCTIVSDSRLISEETAKIIKYKIMLVKVLIKNYNFQIELDLKQYKLL